MTNNHRYANAMLEARCFNAVKEKYTSAMCDLAIRRYEEELVIIQKQDIATYILVLADLLGKAGLSADNIYFPGMAGSLITLYLLGLTNNDPINHEIGLLAKHIDIDVEVPAGNYASITAELEKYNGITMGGQIRMSVILEMLRRLSGNTGVDLIQIPPCDMEVMQLFCTNRDKQKIALLPIPQGSSFIDFLDKFKPQNYDELVKVFAIHLSPYAYDKQKERIIEKTMTISTLITTREECLEYLLNLGLARDEAIEATDFIRKGKPLSPMHQKHWETIKDSIEKMGADEQILFALEQAKYLPARVHVENRLREIMRMAWFLIHYTGEYERQRVWYDGMLKNNN